MKTHVRGTGRSPEIGTDIRPWILMVWVNHLLPDFDGDCGKVRHDHLLRILRPDASD